MPGNMSALGIVGGKRLHRPSLECVVFVELLKVIFVERQLEFIRAAVR